MFPDERRLIGAHVRFWANGSFRGGGAEKTTDIKGQASFKITFPLATPMTFLRANYAVKVSSHDLHGVTWVREARGSHRARTRANTIDADPLRVVVERAPTDVSHLTVEPPVRNQLGSSELGQLVLDDLMELNASLRSSLPVSSLSLTGKILDGFLKFRGEAEAWWDDSLDSKPLGALLQDDRVKTAIRSHLPAGEIDRLRGSAVWVRNAASHQKYAPVTLQEALASAGVIVRALNIWS